MSVFNSVGTPLVVLMVILIVVGSIFGMAISGADIFNPAQSAAEANRINVETNHQQAIFEQEQRLSEVQTNAQIEAIQREQEIAKQTAELSLNYEQQFNAARLAGYQSLIQMRNILLWIFGIATGIGTLLTLGFTLGPKAIVALRETTPNFKTLSTPIQIATRSSDPWKSAEFRKHMVKQARAAEMAIRLDKTKEHHVAPFYDPATVTHEEWNKLPWAR